VRFKCSGADNEVGDLIISVSDTITTPQGVVFEVLGHLGSGTFGQVLKVRNVVNDNVSALKIIRNRNAFCRQAQTEIELLKKLSLPPGSRLKTEDSANGGERKTVDARNLVVQLLDHFMFKSHLCLVFEPLGVNLLQLLQQNKCIGLSTSLIRFFSKQLLQACACSLCL